MDQPNTQKRLQDLAQLSQQFMNTGTLNTSQTGYLEKNIENLNDEKDRQGSARTRRKAAQNLLGSVYHDVTLGEECFFMCCIAFSPTLLGITKPSLVIDFLARWRKTAVPDGFRTLTKELSHRYNGSLPRKDSRCLPQSRKRSHNDASSREIAQEDGPPQPVSVSSKRQRYGTSGPPARRSSDVGAQRSDEDIHGDEENENSDSNEAEKEHGSSVEQEIAEHTTAAEPSDVPLDGVVYKLTLKDAIRILGIEDPEIRLTMPDYPGVTPFVTFDCSVNLAKDFVLTRPKKFM